MSRAPRRSGRRSIRLTDFDYRAPGAHFVTRVESGAFVVMPDQFHAVVWIVAGQCA